MKDYIYAAYAIEEFIEHATPVDVPEACRMLNEFWKKYCEVDVEIFWLVRFTRHNHGAKGAWASLDHMLRTKLKDWDRDCV